MTTPPDAMLAIQTMLAQQTVIQQDLSALRADTSKAITHLEVIDARNINADRLHTDHEARLRILERFRYTMAGVSLIGGIVAGFVGYWIGHVVR